MSQFKKLASDTAIYGVSSIVGRFLNWWLVPYYSHLFLPGEFGVVTNLYSYMAFALVILTYGMETGYFRYASRADDKELVYSTSLVSLFVTSASFLLFVMTFLPQISSVMGYADKPEYIRWIAFIMAFDAFTSIPFAKLRIEGRPIKFAGLKVASIFTNIFLNIFFLSICPKLIAANPDSLVQYIYSADIGVGYVFISNLISSTLVLLLLLPDMKISLRFKRSLLREMLWYSFPILIVGVAGMINQNIDKILLPELIPASANPMAELGIYGANYKLAVIMNMFIQAFRYAFEPFFFSQSKNEDNKKGYALILKYFSIFGFIIFLGISLFIDVFKSLHIIDESYYSGLKVVPIVLMANLFLGVYYTLSLWYKLTDKTRYGAYFALAGAAVTLVVNVVFIPYYGYMASAYAVLLSYALMMVLSYVVGQKHFPINYPIKRIAFYFVLCLIIFTISRFVHLNSMVWNYVLNTILFASFLFVVFRLERKELRLLF
ncbi:MAG: lipopolysaccharide biosynthesis protein [Mangrovibacterium sp.]